jgi:ubiquinone/menaquinone biosynthesis C-methylase UbiE
MGSAVSDFSGEIPRHYDRDLGPIIFSSYAADMARRAVSGGTPSRVLEIAAGSGIATRAVCNALPADAHITATDLHGAMLDIARTKFRAGENVVFQVADAMALPFADVSFDTVICQFGVMFYPDKDKAYREAHRVLMPGGHYLFSVWDAHRHNPYGRIVHEVTRGFFPVDPPVFFDLPFGYHFIDPIKEALLAAGFGEITASIVQQRQLVADFSSFARGFIFGSPGFHQIRQRGEVTALEIQEAVAAAMRREFGDEPSLIRMQAIVFDARRHRAEVQHPLCQRRHPLR